jgi:hypothetical protein
MICPPCDALCVSVAEQEAKEAKARMRARALTDELGTVLGYPLSDKTAFVMLAVVVGVFSVASSLAVLGAGIAILLSQGLLYAYAFTAINRVSEGDLASFMPNVGDVSDLVQPMRVGVAALLISTGPLLVLTFLHPPNEVLSGMGMTTPAALAGGPTPTPAPTLRPEVQALVEDLPAATEAAHVPGEEDEGVELTSTSAGERVVPTFSVDDTRFERRVPAWVFLAYVLAILWKILYSPVALVAAAISRQFFATLNPFAGIGAIVRMGGTYWSAMGIYTAIAVVETLLLAVLGRIPMAGTFLGAFVQSYSYLAIGCLLGLAVFKKAPELGLD